MMVASTIVPPAFAGAGFGASISRAPPASPRLRRTMLGSTRAAPANGGNSGLSSPPELPLPPDRYRQSRARLGCHRAHPPSPRRPAHTIAGGSGSAASAPDQSAAGRARPSDRKVADAPPAAPTVQPAPSQPETPAFAGAGFGAPRLLLLAGVFRLRKAPLKLHRPDPQPRTSGFYLIRTPARLFLRCFPKVRTSA